MNTTSVIALLHGDERTAPAWDRDLRLERFEDLPDLWRITWARHASHEGTTVCEDGFEDWDSGQITTSDVEGPLAEMLALAEAITAGQDVAFKRCATATTPTGAVLLWNPRNAPDAPVCVTARAAATLVASIRAAPSTA